MDGGFSEKLPVMEKCGSLIFGRLQLKLNTLFSLFTIPDRAHDCASREAPVYATLQEFAKEQGLTTFVFDTPSVATNCHSFFEKRGYRRITKDELPFPYDFPDRNSYLYMIQQ